VLILELQLQLRKPELIVNGDETHMMFVHGAAPTRARKGSGRVKLIGVGSDKAQITTTIFVAASGDVLLIQMIF